MALFLSSLGCFGFALVLVGWLGFFGLVWVFLEELVKGKIEMKQKNTVNSHPGSILLQGCLP